MIGSEAKALPTAPAGWKRFEASCNALHGMGERACRPAQQRIYSTSLERG
jgi:hypothetical protein